MMKRTIIILATLALAVGLGFWFWPRSPSKERSSAVVPIPPRERDLPARAADISPVVKTATNQAATNRKFQTLNASERNTFLQTTKQLSFSDIMRIWLQAGRGDQDLMKQGAISTILGVAMRERTPTPEEMAEIREFIGNRANSVFERAQFLGVLAQAATKESVTVLVDLAMKLEERELKKVANTAVKSVGGLWGDGTYHEELSAPLERAWRESKDLELLAAVGVAMVEVGAASGIDLLINAAVADANWDPARARLAEGAFAYATILNPNAVPPLAAVLATSPPNSAVSKLASDALAKSGISEAGTALVGWLRTADERAAPLAHRYVAQSHTESMLRIWEAALDPALPFRSEANREAVRRGLAEYRIRRR
jgi:hypothetical protein